MRTVPSFVTRSVALLVAIAACGPSRPADTTRSGAAADSSTAFGRFADAYFDSLYAFAPSAGVAAGFHQYDARLEIYKLRADYRRAKGNAYSLRDFHDQFVRQGGVPIKLLRRILLPGDTAAVY